MVRALAPVGAAGSPRAVQCDPAVVPLVRRVLQALLRAAVARLRAVGVLQQLAVVPEV